MDESAARAAFNTLRNVDDLSIPDEYKREVADQLASVPNISKAAAMYKDTSHALLAATTKRLKEVEEELAMCKISNIQMYKKLKVLKSRLHTLFGE